MHRWVARLAGGSDGARILVVLGAVLALDTSDKAAIGATSGNLEQAFGIDKTQMGLLVAVTGLVGAAGSIPFGALVDRVNRTRLLTVVVALWSVTMLLTAAAPSFWWLLATRAALGVLAAAAYPAVLSLVGDTFPVDARANAMGRVLTGELVGTGLGIAAAGAIAASFSWRASFAALVLPGAAVVWALRRTDEPERGAMVADGRAPGDQDVDRGGSGDEHVSLWRALRWVLTIRTNVILIVASSLGYYLFAGIRAFGVQFADHHYGVGQGVAASLVFLIGPGGLAGVALGGRLSDRALQRGRRDVRIVVPAAALAMAGLIFVPAVVVTSVWVAVPLLAAAAFFVGLAYPPLEAARLDVVPPRLWGRAESARTIARAGLEGLAPLAFGAIAQYVFGGETAGGLEQTFLVMVIPLFASCGVLLLARRAYVTDRQAAQDAAREGVAARAREHSAVPA